MQLQIFSIPAFESQTAIDEMNKFMRSNRVVDIEKHYVASPEGGFWTFCIKYVLGAPVAPAFERKEKVDYRSILDAVTFENFENLRKFRKQIADQEGVPAYAVFTDEELSNIAKLKDISMPSILTIKGIGIKKVEKYGESLTILFKTNNNEEAGEFNL